MIGNNNTYNVKLSGFPIDAKTSAIEDYISQFVTPKNLVKNRSPETKTFIGSVTFECVTDDLFVNIADAIESVPFADKFPIYPELNLRKNKVVIKKAPMIFEYKDKPFIFHPLELPQLNSPHDTQKDIEKEKQKDQERESKAESSHRDNHTDSPRKSRDDIDRSKRNDKDKHDDERISHPDDSDYNRRRDK